MSGLRSIIRASRFQQTHSRLWVFSVVVRWTGRADLAGAATRLGLEDHHWLRLDLEGQAAQTVTAPAGSREVAFTKLYQSRNQE